MEVARSYAETLRELAEAGLYKHERVIETPQAVRLRADGRELLNFCANNYLGLANDARLKAAAMRGLETYGLGMSSVRFICGTQSIHKQLEARIAEFLGMEDCILYSSCFDANGGFFEPLLDGRDAIVSDALNHASLIDGIRLCKARRYRYRHADLTDLKTRLDAARSEGDGRILVVTDGVFSMDGDVAPLAGICDAAEDAGAIVLVDDSHATGFYGVTGRGAIEACGVMGRVHAVTSTFGKALGGASGGFTAGRRAMIDLLRQRSRPYLFSNALPPLLAAATLECLDIISESTALRDRLFANTRHFRTAMAQAGFSLAAGEHPIVPIMLGEASVAVRMAEAMFEEGIYVVAFSYPVVPQGAARIRVQISAAHTKEDIDKAVAAFTNVKKAMALT